MSQSGGTQAELFQQHPTQPSAPDAAPQAEDPRSAQAQVDDKHAAITGELRAKVDTLWMSFYSNGISNPLSVIEQISYLLFMRELDRIESTHEKKALRLGHDFTDRIFGPDQQHYRWSHFMNEADPKAMFEMVQQAFHFIKNDLQPSDTDQLSAYQKHMRSAVFLIPSAGMIKSVVSQISALPTGRDTMGDLYEYMLGKIASAGQNGQFRTPRHIIKMIVKMMNPQPNDLICDPSCGTAGFLLLAAEELRDTMLMDPELRRHFERDMFTGYDFDGTMLRIGTMNLILHGISDPTIENRNSLSDQNPDSDKFTLILANPPFKGSVAKDELSKDLTKPHATTKSELLFLRLCLRMLQVGGRAAVIIPDGVLFGSSKAHVATRKLLVDEHKLDAVISMPSGVFKPYAGVSTAVLCFTRTDSGGTDQVWFYDMQADGFSLDDKRDPIDTNDIPELLQQWQQRDPAAPQDRKAKAFFVPVDELRDNQYDLSLNRYKEIEYEAIDYDPPHTILDQLDQLDQTHRQLLQELREMIG